MAELMRFLWLIAVEVAIIALLVLCDALLPGLLPRTRRALVAMPWWSLLVGLVNVAFFGLLSAALLAPGGVVALVGGALATILLALVAAGLAATARLLGERLRPGAADPLRQFLVGAATLVLAASVPLVGWFLVLPLAGLAGVGALLIAIVQRRPAPDPREGSPPPPVYPSPPPLPWEAGPPQGGDTQGWR